MPDGSVTELQEVPGGQLGAGELVDRHDRHTLGRARLDGNQGMSFGSCATA